jgi:hypothetical protein
MATKTTNLNLILPANGEYFNIWDQPNNGNFTIIDTVLGAVQAEVIAARGSADNLNDRISAGLDSSGNPLPSAEIVTARVSPIYGGFSNSVAFSLGQRISQVEFETFNARSSLSSLQAAIAWDADQNKNNSVISAATNYLTFTGAVVSLNGSVTPLVANINGYRQVARSILTTTISGAAGTYYLSLTSVAGGQQYLNVTGSTGALQSYAGNGLIATLSDSTQNFITAGVQPGDVLNITAPADDPNDGQYVVLATNATDPTNLTTSQIAVVGQFTSTGSGYSYNLNNPVSPQLGFTGTAHAKTFTRLANKIFIGRCVFDGTNITGLTIYALQGIYSGFTSVTLSGGNYSLTIPHNLGYFPSKVSFYGSQASNFTASLDQLGVGDMTSSTLQRSVISQTNDLTVLVKNPTNGVFYKDFSGTSQTSGFLYVVAER